MPKKAQWPVPKMERVNSELNLNHLSWDDIRVFLVCIKEPSFRRAAEKLKMSASTVVRRMEQLEEALGTSLFDRLPDGVKLTPEGLAIKDSAQSMERSLFELLYQRQKSDCRAKGQISISITEGLGAYWVIPRLVRFQRQFPNLILNVQCAMKSADVLRLEADVAIQYERPKNPELIIAKLGRMHVYPFASKDYLETYGHPKNLKEALNHRFVQQIASQLDEKIWAQKLGIDNIDDIVGIRTNSSTSLFYAVEQGGGIGALPTYALALNAPVIPVDIGINHSLDLWLTYHPSIKKTPRKAMVIDWLKSIFDPQIYPWFRDEFIHPDKLLEILPEEALMNLNKNYFSVKPFGR